MTRVCIELDEGMNRQLKQYALDRYGSTHGKQQAIIKAALIDYLKQERKSAIEEAQKTPEVAPKPAAKAATRPVKGKAKRTGGKPFGSDTATTTKVRELWASGERNIREITKQVPPYTYSAVHNWVKRNLSKEVPSATS